MAEEWDWTPGGPTHIAFVAASPEHVDAFHRAGEAGGRHYAAFLLDPDGNNSEAVHRSF